MDDKTKDLLKNQNNNLMAEIIGRYTESRVVITEKFLGDAITEWGFNKDDIIKDLQELKQYKETGFKPEDYKKKCEQLDREIEELYKEITNKNNIEYHKGYKNGFIEGQAKGLDVATNVLAMQVKPILIKYENKEMADNIIKNIKGE